MQILQNWILSINTGFKSRCYVDLFYNDLGILNMSARNMHLTGMLMYKICNHVFDDFFTYNYEVHDHDTRISNHLHVPHIKSTLLTFGITSLIARFMGPTWDSSGADRTQVGHMLAP